MEAVTGTGNIDGKNIQQLKTIISGIWLAGFITVILSFLTSVIRMRRLLSTAVPEDIDINGKMVRVYLSEQISYPFLFGLVKPKIYLPYSIDTSTVEYVIAHERVHIRRRDYLTKRIAFLLVACYWFHPLVWVAYVLCGKDMEMACDEAVMRSNKDMESWEYADALLACSVGTHRVILSPLAFGESDVKKRVEHIMKYKKPSKKVLIMCVMMIAIIGIIVFTTQSTSGVKSVVTDNQTANNRIADNQTADNQMIDSRAHQSVNYKMNGGVGGQKTQGDTQNIQKDQQNAAQSETRRKAELGVNNGDNGSTPKNTLSETGSEHKSGDTTQSDKDTGNKDKKNRRINNSDLTVEEFIRITGSDDFEANILKHGIGVFEQFDNYTREYGRDNDITTALRFDRLPYGDYHYNIDIEYDLSSSIAPGYITDIRMGREETADSCVIYSTDSKWKSTKASDFVAHDSTLLDEIDVDIPSGYHLGPYDAMIGPGQPGGGYLLLGNHGEGTGEGYPDSIPEEWHVPGSISRFNLYNNLSWLGNHMGQEGEYEAVDGCIGEAWLGEYNFELIGATVNDHGLPGDTRDNVISHYWYVFIVMSENEDGLQSGYAVSLNKNWFTKEQVISLAQSIKKK